MRKNRKENERALRTLCACAEILFKNVKFSEATKKWKIGHEPVRFALRSVNKRNLSDLENSLVAIKNAMNDARIALVDASRKSTERKVNRSLSDPNNRRRKPIQKTLF